MVVNGRVGRRWRGGAAVRSGREASAGATIDGGA